MRPVIRAALDCAAMYLIVVASVVVVWVIWQ